MAFNAPGTSGKRSSIALLAASRMRTRAYRLMSRFESCQSLLPRDRWEGVQEFIKAMVTREIVDEVSERHTGANEDRRPPRISGSL